MQESLFNPAWYSASELKFKLRHHAQIHRHHYRGELMYVMQDHITGNLHRFTPEVYQIIGLMNGERSLQEIWEISCRALGDRMPTQSDIISLISRLHQNNLIQSDKLPVIRDLDKRRRQHDRKRLVQAFKMPLAIRLPILDPERFLQLTSRFVLPLISRIGAFIWLAVVIYGIMQAAVHWTALTQNLSDQLFSLKNVLLLALVYPLVKVVHELGHAYCAKKWGGEIHEIGVILLVFFPVPYVDASSASAFSNKYHRMLVGAAGILVEVFLAAAAMIAWAHLEPGLLRAMMFNVMLISGVSTLLFNGNPLLKFDAYYVLADYVEIPNLAKKGNDYIGYLFKRYFAQVKDIHTPVRSTSEGVIITLYAILAFLYRIFITIAIMLFVSGQFFFFGVIIGAWFIFMSIIYPTMKVLAKPFTDPVLRQNQGRMFSAIAVTIATIGVLLFVVPVSLSTNTQGVTWANEQAYLRTSETGFVKNINVRSSQYVEQGQPILDLENVKLDAHVEVLLHQLKEAEERYQASIKDRAVAEIVREEKAFVEQEYLRSVERQKQLTLRAHRSGKLVLHNTSGLKDKLIKRGSVLGHITDEHSLPVVAMVSEQDIDYVERNTKRIETQFASRPGKVYSARIIRISPDANHLLPSKTLSIEGGGPIVVDPQSRNKAKTFEPYYQIELEIDGHDLPRLEERIYVRFVHDPEPVFYRVYRVFGRLFRG